MNESEIGFNIIKNIIKNQNEVLLKQIAERYSMDFYSLKDSYLRPEYYLPIVQKTKKVNNNGNRNGDEKQDNNET